MRISDWSSDVCSSDLRVGQLRVAQLARPRPPLPRGPEHALGQRRELAAAPGLVLGIDEMGTEHRTDQLVGVRAEDRGERRVGIDDRTLRSEEHTSELQSLMRISYAVFCLKKKTP